MRWILCAVLLFIACAEHGLRRASDAPSNRATTAQATKPTSPPEKFAPSSAPAFFMTPSPEGLKPVADAIASARTSIKMIMFHLTDRAIVLALIEAKRRGVDVALILDAKNLESKSSAKIVEELKNSGIIVTPSSREFSITHAKAMIIDDRQAVIMSLNLTTLYEKTRDYAIVTEDPAVIVEFRRVFEADVANAAANTKNTPPLSCPALVWSPVNSEKGLVALIDSAKSMIVASSENLGDAAIDRALAAAAARGVKTRVLAPMCDMNPNPLFNVPIVREMDLEKIDARLMPGPSSRDLPYIHAKMILVDGARGYVGSVNFSENSTHHARELGILFDDHAAVSAIAAAFEVDWSKALPPPTDTTDLCKHAP